jgi:hypothetical protein
MLVKNLTDYERGKREGLRMAIRAIKLWHSTRNPDDIGDMASWEISQACARAVDRKLKGKSPVEDDGTAGWP